MDCTNDEERKLKEEEKYIDDLLLGLNYFIVAVPNQELQKRRRERTV